MQKEVMREANALGTRADTNNKMWFAISVMDLNSDSLITFMNLKKNRFLNKDFVKCISIIFSNIITYLQYSSKVHAQCMCKTFTHFVFSGKACIKGPVLSTFLLLLFNTVTVPKSPWTYSPILFLWETFTDNCQQIVLQNKWNICYSWTSNKQSPTGNGVVTVTYWFYRIGLL